jgi:pimeloyl-ACP methyl ester carboxylesterase
VPDSPAPAPRLPRVDPVGRVPDAPPAVVLLLHGGRSASRESGGRRRLTYWRMRPFARGPRRAGLAVYLLRYRYRGWNGAARDAQRDAAAGLAEIAERHPGVPVVLVGHSMGGRAALGAAGAPNAVAVCALAPWLDGSDPVDQLAGRTVLIAHGDRDRWTSPRASFEYAVRAKRVTGRVARFEVPGAGHFLLSRPGRWHRLVTRFVAGATGVGPEDPEIATALRLPAPAGLRAALAGPPAAHPPQPADRGRRRLPARRNRRRAAR